MKFSTCRFIVAALLIVTTTCRTVHPTCPDRAIVDAAVAFMSQRIGGTATLYCETIPPNLKQVQSFTPPVPKDKLFNDLLRRNRMSASFQSSTVPCNSERLGSIAVSLPAFSYKRDYAMIFVGRFFPPTIPGNPETIDDSHILLLEQHGGTWAIVHEYGYRVD
jgi:hypothetical protein